MKQILVTRAAADAMRTAAELRRRGFEPLVAPVTRIVATEAPPPSGTWDALIVTSAHAAEALGALTNRQIPVFAVGPRTAEAVRDAGFGAVQATGGDAKSLSDLVSRYVAPKAHLLHVTTKHHKDEPAASLQSAGFTIVSWDAYEAQAMASLPLNAQEALRAGRIAAALQYSRRSADLFLQLATEANLISTLGHFPHLCLSEDVAEPLRALGLSVRVAVTPDEPALLAMLDG